MQLDDLDFADDLALLLHTQQQIQERTTSVKAASVAVGLDIHKWKSKILRYNTTCNNQTSLDGEDLEDVKTFTYLENIIDKHCGSDADFGLIKNNKENSLEEKTGYAQETLDPDVVLLGTRQEGVPVILRALVLPNGFDPVRCMSSIYPPTPIPTPYFATTNIDNEEEEEEGEEKKEENNNNCPVGIVNYYSLLELSSSSPSSSSSSSPSS
ncbi:unnamed protein product [Schistosoma curassoni]|uniref:Reverse transcriptase domain-containing protein n=1 Tax=Schistosoma curassoni TaxID=6186 RepID=A0A183K118_9TREM|nr:unnamed protein product [Schistosoma curassoni]